MKKTYKTPNARAHKIEPVVLKSTSHHDNGNHNGWNNPNNPHYEPDEE